MYTQKETLSRSQGLSANSSMDKLLNSWNSKTTTKIHPSLKKAGNAIRLLYLEPADFYNADIRCELHEASLDERPVYKALSYAWGDANITLPIFINGISYHVTANCHAALCRLREIGERCLWIDAICINQRSDEEKSVQVALMRDIYHVADEVIVWLGRAQKDRHRKDEEHEKSVMAILHTLSYGLNHTEDPKTFLEYAENILSQHGAYSWKRLDEFFQHPWFLRLWAHQEYTVAANVKALLQYHVEPFEKISEFASRLQKALARVKWEDLFDRVPWPRELPESVLSVVQRTSPRLQYDRSQRHLSGTSLFTLMSLTQRCKCFDPRDRVFAIIGLTTYASLVGDKDGQINYSQSLSQIYTQITWIMISRSQSLQPLCFSGQGHAQEGEKSQPLRKTVKRRFLENKVHFPSWVFDWRETRRAFLENQYKASNGTVLGASFDKSSSVLRVAGVKVQKVLETFHFENIPSTWDYHQFGMIMEWLPKAEGLVMWRKRFSTYPGGHDPTDAWIRTITADVVKSNGRYVRLNDGIIQRWKSVFGFDQETLYGELNTQSEDRERRGAVDLSMNQELVEMIKKIDIADKLQDSNNDRDTMGVGVNGQSNLWERWELRISIAEAIRRTVLDRVFFLTESGHMGFGPMALQEGDVICILQGCDVPLLINRRGDEYHLVGDSFVWGLMDGEGLKDKKETDFEVIELR